MATQTQHGFKGLLGKLLVVEVDRQLDIVPGNRFDPLDFPDDLAEGIHLVAHVPGLPAQNALVCLLDSVLTDALVRRVLQRPVVGQLPFEDRTHETDDVCADRSVRIFTTPTLLNVDSRVVLGPFAKEQRGLFRNALFQRQGLQRVVQLALVPPLEFGNRSLKGPRQTQEELDSLGILANHRAIDGGDEDTLVVGEDPTVDVEDSTPLGQQLNRP